MDVGSICGTSFIYCSQAWLWTGLRVCSAFWQFPVFHVDDGDWMTWGGDIFPITSIFLTFSLYIYFVFLGHLFLLTTFIPNGLEKMVCQCNFNLFGWHPSDVTGWNLVIYLSIKFDSCSSNSFVGTSCSTLYGQDAWFNFHLSVHLFASV